MKKLQASFKLGNKSVTLCDSNASALMELIARKKKGMTHLDFQDATGSYRLSARIYDLRDAGLEIHDEWERTEDSKYKRYYLRSAVGDVKIQPRA